MPLTPGTRLGHYDVTALLGEGGMGQVWQATDTQLNRQVALKILPDAFAADPDRLARFKREAQILAKLNHPNIAAIYGIEESEGTRALVLELVEGPTLADRISKGPIPLDEALPIAKQIAEALEAAHEAGVIHRDLKPANIKVREDGTVKVLDFGLAKALDPTPQGDPSESPTLTAAATKMGVIMGTAAYMAPEQAKGKVADKRADVWAFGCVLYEMLTGRRVFDGGDVAETLAGVIKSEPKWDALPTELPPALGTYLRRCLQKDPRERIRDIGDVRLAMEGAFETTVQATPVPTEGASAQLRVWQRRVPAALSGLVLAALTGVAVWGLKPQTLARPLVRFAITPPGPEWLGISNNAPDLTISPDGRHIVNRAPGRNGGLVVRALDQLEATRQPELGQVFSPFMSPDGASVGFATPGGGGLLQSVSVFGGPAVTICRLPGGSLLGGIGASWGTDDTIIFGTGQPSGLWRVSADGGEPEELTAPNRERGEVNHHWPEILPGGRAVLFTIIPAGSVENAQIAVLDLETGAQTVLVPGGSNPRYAPTGHIVYVVGSTLRAVGFDLERLAVTTNPLPVVDGVITKGTGAANFSFSRDGTLVYVPGTDTGSGLQRSLVWVDREGREEPLALDPGGYDWPRVSPDGTRVAVDVSGPEGTDVWTSDVARGTLSILTPDPGAYSHPVWSRDGERLVFRRVGWSGLFGKAADGSGAVEPLLTVEDAQQLTDFAPVDWSPDGNELLFSYRAPNTSRDIGVLSMQGEQSWQPLLNSAAFVSHPALSPDGQWIAYTSDETGQREVYVERFPDLGNREQISTGGGQAPVWSPDGRELFYRGRGVGARMMVVPIETEPALTLGTATVVFEGTYYRAGWRAYDLAPDGRFLMIKPTGAATEDTASAPDQIVVVEGWFEELKRLVPTN